MTQPDSAKNYDRLLVTDFTYLPEVSHAPLARTAVRIGTRAMSSSVNPDDVRPLVNSESLPSVSPVNLLGASSPFAPFARIMRTRIEKQSLVTCLLPTAPARARLDATRRDRRTRASI